MVDPVLVNCEYSQIITKALRAVGVEAFSCDILDTEGNPDWHIKGDAIEVAHSRQWAGMIAHPPCTRLANSGVKHLYIGQKRENGLCAIAYREMMHAAAFFNALKNAPIKFKAIENPIMHLYAADRTGGRATQYVQPWWFGSQKNKATGFRLFGLPKLVKTDVVGPMPKTVLKGTAEYRSWNECWYMSPGPDRGKERARTDPAVAMAIAEQWGPYFRGEKHDTRP
jgi:hypothetical protein